MDRFLRICLSLAVVWQTINGESRSYSFSKTASSAAYLQFQSASWQAATSGQMQHLSLRFRTHNPQGLLVYIADGAVTTRLMDGHIEVSSAATATSPAGATFQDSQRTHHAANVSIKT